ncbi:riboflavin synthase [bacterium]|nr:riboflavin synthase [bacterium]
MFTGIAEEVGYVKYVDNSALTVECKKVLEDAKIGDSIAINGVCETLTDIYQHEFKVRISEETFSITNFSKLKVGDKLNLERALTLNPRLGGHIVSGHIDCLGKCVKINNLNEFYNLFFEIPKSQMKYIVYKGSITINGVSLTVAEIDNNIVKIAVIPHTFNNTNFSELKIGDFVNVETDIIGRYVEKLLLVNNNKSGISMELLEENGFV